MACDKCPAPGSEVEQTTSDDATRPSRVLEWGSRILPEGSALLSSSCCWLPALLDWVFAGSITATGMERLRPFFLAISIITLAWGIRREGLSRGMVRRAIISVILVAWQGYNQRRQAVNGHHHSCH
ncbi:hypothetical protein BDV27DRAFT_135122 [Aspergillus caelatus]|uniref:Uncharacterized protein n=1 Tax=Aspergillus caelatus TaxID=61420 RepID=A0A5N6ZR01_9EURO|nr:uncharacterized protein BDV27DRAFT_135122 [Aspergillus caelatus]KAE8360067.1 hypothetical protein BDV27DRAFT_135122 [Aspergillus caelatus]